MLAYGIIIPATAGVIVRPFRLPEAVWALAGALLLVAARPAAAGAMRSAASARALDVYLFLIGMMLLAELARREGLFDWLAAHAVEPCAAARRSGCSC